MNDLCKSYLVLEGELSEELEPLHLKSVRELSADKDERGWLELEGRGKQNHFPFPYWSSYSSIQGNFWQSDPGNVNVTQGLLFADVREQRNKYPAYLCKFNAIWVEVFTLNKNIYDALHRFVIILSQTALSLPPYKLSGVQTRFCKPSTHCLNDDLASD